jgi:hypothetical protein
MPAKYAPSPWPLIVFALSFSPAAAIAVASLAHAEEGSQHPQAQVAAAPAANTSFHCDAQPGGWCDLRDWSGMDRAPTAAHAPAVHH